MSWQFTVGVMAKGKAERMLAENNSMLAMAMVPPAAPASMAKN
jgi:hypothetical protein